MKVATDHPGAEPVAETEHVFVLTRAFAGRPESVGAARSWVAGFFGSSAAADAALMTSELFTNAVLHSASGLPGGAVTVTVTPGDGAARVDVIDQGESPACARHGLGKGLSIVAQLADVFGADGCDRWFALSTGDAARDAEGTR
jgi:Histidine kinase-like ATPase domain